MAILQLFQAARSTGLDIISAFFSLMGQEILFLCALGVIYWCISKKTAYKLFFAYITASCICNIACAAIHMPMPWMSDASLNTIGLVQTFASGYAFPSNGILNITLLASMLFLNRRKFLIRIGCIASVILTVFAYLYLCITTPWGAVCALLIGAAASAVFSTFIDSMLFDRSRFRIYAGIQLIPVFVLICVTLSFYFYDLLEPAPMMEIINRTGIYIGLLISWYIETSRINFTVRTNRLWKQVVKASCGIFTILAVYLMLTVLFKIIPGFLFGDMVRGLVTVICGFGVFPLLIRIFFAARYSH